jgi:hypothetical protein
VTAEDKVESVGGRETRWGRADYHGGRSPDENAGWLASVWSRWFEGPRPDPWWFGYGAEWAVPRGAILARPRAWWVAAHEAACAAAMDSRGWATDPASAWAWELIWGYAFADPAEFPAREQPAGFARGPAPTGPPPRALVPLAESIAVVRAIRDCPARKPVGCGCDGRAECRIDDPAGRVVERAACEACKRTELFPTIASQPCPTAAETIPAPGP